MAHVARVVVVVVVVGAVVAGYPRWTQPPPSGGQSPFESNTPGVHKESSTKGALMHAKGAKLRSRVQQ